MRYDWLVAMTIIFCHMAITIHIKFVFGLRHHTCCRHHPWCRHHHTHLLSSSRCIVLSSVRTSCCRLDASCCRHGSWCCRRDTRSCRVAPDVVVLTPHVVVRTSCCRHYASCCRHGSCCCRRDTRSCRVAPAVVVCRLLSSRRLLLSSRQLLLSSRDCCCRLQLFFFVRKHNLHCTYEYMYTGTLALAGSPCKAQMLFLTII